MRKWVVAMAALWAAGFASPAAWAQQTILARSGAWEVFEGKTDQGRDVCGISATVGERYFGLKLFGGNDTFSGNWSDNDESLGVVDITNSSP